MASQLASAFVEISANDSKFQASYKRIQSQVASLSKSFKTLDTNINSAFSNNKNVKEFSTNFSKVSGAINQSTGTLSKFAKETKGVSSLFRSLNTSINKTFASSSKLDSFVSGFQRVTSAIQGSTGNISRFAKETQGLSKVFSTLNTSIQKTFSNTQKIDLFAKNLNKVSEAVKKSANKMTTFSKSTSGVGSTLTALNRAVNGMVANTERVSAFVNGLLRISNALRLANPHIAEFSRAAQILNNSLKATVGSAKQTSAVLGAYSTVLKKVDTLNKRVASQNNKLNTSFKNAGAGAKYAQTNVRGLSASLLSLSNIIKTYIGIKAFQGLYDMARGFTTFEQQITNAGINLRVVGDEFDNINKKALELGKSTIFSATEAASAIDILAKNGVAYQDVMDGALESSLAFAASVDADLQTAADVATDAMQLFGKSAKDLDDVVNISTGTILTSKLNVQEYKQALANAAAGAKGAGVSFEELNAILGLTAQSFVYGRNQGTSFKTFFTRLTPETDKQIEAFKKLGLIVNGKNKLFDNGQFVGLRETIDLLSESVKGLTNEQRILLTKNAFGTEGLKAFDALASRTTEDFDLLMSRIGDTDALDIMAKKTDTVSAQLKILGAVISTTITEAILPFNESMKNSIKELINWFNTLSDNTAFKSFVNGFAEAISTVYNIGRSFTVSFSKELSNLFSDIDTKDFKQTWQEIRETLISVASIAGKYLAKAISIGVTAFSYLNKTLEGVSKILGISKQRFIELGVAALIGVKIFTSFKSILSPIGTSILQIGSAMLKTKKYVADGSSSFSLLSKSILGLGSAIKYVFMNPVVLAWAAAIVVALSFLESAFSGRLNNISKFVIDFGLSLFKIFTGIHKDIFNIFTGAWEDIIESLQLFGIDFGGTWVDIAKGAGKTISDFVSKVWDSLTGLGRSINEFFGNLFDPIINGIKYLYKAAGNLVGKSLDAINQAGASLKKGGEDLSKGLGEGIDFAGDKLQEYTNGFENTRSGLEDLKNSFKNLGIGIGSESNVSKELDSIGSQISDNTKGIEGFNQALFKGYKTSFDEVDYDTDFETPTGSVDYGDTEDSLASGSVQEKSLTAYQMSQLINSINAELYNSTKNMQKTIQLYDDNVLAIGDNGERIVDNLKYLSSTLKTQKITLPEFDTDGWDNSTTNAFNNTQEAIKNMISTLNETGDAFQDALINKNNELAINDLRDSIVQLDKTIVYMEESIKQLDNAFDEVYNSLKDTLSGIQNEITAVDDEIKKMTGEYDYQINLQKKEDEISSTEADLEAKKAEIEKQAKLDLLKVTEQLDDANLKLIADKTDASVTANDIAIQEEELKALKEKFELQKDIYADVNKSPEVQAIKDRIDALNEERKLLKFTQDIETQDTGNLSDNQLQYYKKLDQAQQLQIDKQLELIRLNNVKQELEKKGSALEELITKAREGEINITQGGIVQATEKADLTKQELKDVQELYDLVKQDPRLKQQLESLTTTRVQAELEKQTLDELTKKREFAYTLFGQYEEEISRIKNEQHEKDKTAIDELISKYDDLSTKQKEVIDSYVNRQNSAIESIGNTWATQVAQMGGRISGNANLGFKTGGFTGSGNINKIAGVVHKGEYVIPNDVMKKIAPTGMLGALENLRRGFKDGGYTSNQVTNNSPSTNNNVKINVQQNIADGVDFKAAAKELFYLFNSRLAT